MPLIFRTTLCQLREEPHSLRKSVSARGHAGTIQGIDARMGVAADEAIRAIKSPGSAKWQRTQTGASR
jgi:hypothetical protein